MQMSLAPKDEGARPGRLLRAHQMLCGLNLAPADEAMKKAQAR